MPSKLLIIAWPMKVLMPGGPNLERLDLARILHKLGRSAEALHLLAEIDRSMANLIDPDEDDRCLQAEAQDLRSTVRLACPPES